MARKIETVTITPERVYQCQECEHEFTREDGVGRNGTMCPECTNKFGSILIERAIRCPHCEEFIDLEDL